MTLDEVLDRQRDRLFAEADAAREAAAEVVRVHPGSHAGPCPASSGGTITRGEVEGLGGAIWHLDADQAPPSWWATTGLIVAPDTPDELARQRAAREAELAAAELADRASSRAVHGIG